MINKNNKKKKNCGFLLNYKIMRELNVSNFFLMVKYTYKRKKNIIYELFLRETIVIF